MLTASHSLNNPSLFVAVFLAENSQLPFTHISRSCFHFVTIINNVKAKCQYLLSQFYALSNVILGALNGNSYFNVHYLHKKNVEIVLSSALYVINILPQSISMWNWNVLIHNRYSMWWMFKIELIFELLLLSMWCIDVCMLLTVFRTFTKKVMLTRLICLRRATIKLPQHKLCNIVRFMRKLAGAFRG